MLRLLQVANMMSGKWYVKVHVIKSKQMKNKSTQIFLFHLSQPLFFKLSII